MEKKDLAVMTKKELSDYQNEKENDLRSEMSQRQSLSAEKLLLGNKIKELRKEIIDTDIKLSDSKEKYDVADTNVKILNSLLREIKNRYFNVEI